MVSIDEKKKILEDLKNQNKSYDEEKELDKKIAREKQKKYERTFMGKLGKGTAVLGKALFSTAEKKTRPKK